MGVHQAHEAASGRSCVVHMWSATGRKGWLPCHPALSVLDRTAARHGRPWPSASSRKLTACTPIKPAGTISIGYASRCRGDRTGPRYQCAQARLRVHPPCAEPIERCPIWNSGTGTATPRSSPIAKKALISPVAWDEKAAEPAAVRTGLGMRKPPTRPRNYCPGGFIILDDYMQSPCRGH